MQIKVKYKKSVDHITQAHEGEWYDLRASQEYMLMPGDYAEIDLGVCIELPEGYEAIIAPRSSTFRNWGILMTGSIGVIDHKYKGDNDWWRMPVLATRTARICRNDRVCQFRIQKVQPEAEFVEVESMNNDSRGGLGSTGVN